MISSTQHTTRGFLYQHEACRYRASKQHGEVLQHLTVNTREIFLASMHADKERAANNMGLSSQLTGYTCDFFLASMHHTTRDISFQSGQVTSFLVLAIESVVPFSTACIEGCTGTFVSCITQASEHQAMSCTRTSGVFFSYLR